MTCRCPYENLEKHDIKWRQLDNFCGPDPAGWSMQVGFHDAAYANITYCPLCGGSLEERPQKTESDLRTYDMPIAKILEQGLIRDRHRREDAEFVDMFDRAHKNVIKATKEMIDAEETKNQKGHDRVPE